MSDTARFTSLQMPSLFELSAKVCRKDALRYLGYSGQDIDRAMEAVFEEATRECEAFKPKGVAAIFPIDRILCDPESRSGYVLLGEGGPRFEGYSIAKFLSCCEHAVLIGATLGMESELILNRARALDSVSGLFLDACASTCIESAVDDLQNRLDGLLEPSGFKSVSRFSPGYGDFSLEIQPDFLKAISADRLLGISVNRKNMLIPSKSITAVVSVSPI